MKIYRLVTWLAVGVFLLGLVSVCAAAEQEPLLPTTSLAGQTVPEFSLNNVDGKTFSFPKAAQGKKLTAIVFFSTGCSACQREMAILNDIAQENSKLQIYTLVVDPRGAEAIKAFSDKYKTEYLLDPEFTIPEKFGFSFTPALVLVDDAGVIITTKGGFHPRKDPPALINTVMKNLK